jgi:hypothetical protein
LGIILITGQVGGKEPPLTVRVCNFGNVDNATLFRAAATARRIFRDANIETEWIVAGDARKLDPAILTVQIFGGHSKRSEVKDAFGIAMFGKDKVPFLADVFFGTIEEVANTRKDQAILLGHVMAHEVGHLLLGTEHTAGTIMAAGLGSRDLPDMEAGRLQFSRHDSERLSLAVARRQSVAAGGSIGAPREAPN